MTMARTVRSVCFVGPMLGSNPGWVLSQGEILARNLKGEGYEVAITSRRSGRVARLVDTLVSMIRFARTTDVFVVSVFSGLGFVMADVTSIAARVLRRPLILVLRGGNLPQFERRHRRWVRRVIRRADRVVVPSQYLRRVTVASGADVRVIPNVLPIESYPNRERSRIAPRILWMRTFEHIYNPEMALRVFGRLKRAMPEARLTMAGQDRGLEAHMRVLAVTLGVAEDVAFPGFLDEHRKRQAFSEHDIFLNTNRIDNAPVSVLEAAASGMIVVATDVGGVRDLFEHERSTLLVPDNDEAGAAAAIERLLGDPSLCARLSRGGRSVAEASAWESVGPRWTDLFESVGRHR